MELTQFNTYRVFCMGINYKIYATTWSVGEDGLKLFQYDAGSKEEKVVAWFTTFDYWGLDSAFA